jgi:hypothetical protein
MTTQKNIKKNIINCIDDFNEYVKDFQNEFRREPMDDEELKEYMLEKYSVSELLKNVSL